MKKIFTSFKSLLLATAFVSPVLLFNCAEEQLPEGYQPSLVRQHLQLKTTTASFGYNTNLTQTISVIGENTPWTLTGLPDWLTASATTGTGAATITLTAKENTSADNARAAVLTFASTAGDYQYSKTISVGQPKADPYITNTTTSLSFSSGGETKAFNINANSTWKVSQCPNWLSLTPDNGQSGSTSVCATSQENPNADKREGTIIIGLEKFNKNQEIKVSQEGKEFNDLVDRLEFPNTASNQILTVETDGHWTAKSSFSWIHLTPTSGQGRGTLQISVDANEGKDERSGTISISVGTTTQQIIIVQSGRYITISYNDLISNSKPTTIHLSLISNTDWTATSSDENWLTVDKKQGTGNASLTLSIADNPSIHERTATVTFVTEAETKILSFTQPGRTLSVNPESIAFTNEGGTSDVLTVTTDGSYTITYEETWISVKQIDNTFTITASENQDETTRKAIVNVAITGLKDGESLMQSIRVVQAKYIVPDPLGLCPDNNHPHMIDLGLIVNSENVKFACCNVGAESEANPQVQYGDYFAWASTSVYPAQSQYWEYGVVTKYCDNNLYGYLDKKLVLEPMDDAATANWGFNDAGTWRMPTKDELSALTTTNSFRWNWTTLGGHNGFKVTSKANGNSIFLPAAGYCNGEVENEGSDVCYWSASLLTEHAHYGVCLSLSSSSYIAVGFNYRNCGLSVRPVIVGSYLTVNPSSLTFESGASSDFIYVNTDHDYTITVSDTWITATPLTDKKEVLIEVTANMGSESRSGTITITSGEYTKTIFITQEFKLNLCPDDNHPHMIDMGTGLKWACCNVGASSPTDFGDYFAWGETVPYGQEDKNNTLNYTETGNYVKTTFNWSTYKWCNGSSSTITKYCDDSSYGIVDNKTQLELSDDAANANWDSRYHRMPTSTEAGALLENCNWTWTSIHGVYGCKVTSNINGNTIFLPAAGTRYGTRLNDCNEEGRYWTSKGFDFVGIDLFLYKNGDHHISNCERCAGQSVRPVTE